MSTYLDICSLLILMVEPHIGHEEDVPLQPEVLLAQDLTDWLCWPGQVVGPGEGLGGQH